MNLWFIAYHFPVRISSAIAAIFCNQLKAVRTAVLHFCGRLASKRYKEEPTVLPVALNALPGARCVVSGRDTVRLALDALRCRTTVSTFCTCLVVHNPVA